MPVDFASIAGYFAVVAMIGLWSGFTHLPPGGRIAVACEGPRRNGTPETPDPGSGKVGDSASIIHRGSKGST
jgi:hypothetical protein